MFEGRHDSHCNTFGAMWNFFVHVTENSNSKNIAVQLLQILHAQPEISMH